MGARRNRFHRHSTTRGEGNSGTGSWPRRFGATIDAWSCLAYRLIHPVTMGAWSEPRRPRRLIKARLRAEHGTDAEDRAHAGHGQARFLAGRPPGRLLAEARRTAARW
jgi:hypothetical protein